MGEQCGLARGARGEYRDLDVYLDGTTAISTSVMVLGSPLNFFRDTVTGQGEFSSSSPVAFVRPYGNALTADDAATLFKQRRSHWDVGSGAG